MDIIRNIKIVDFQQNGHGVGKDEEGYVYFVHHAVPEDVVDIQVIRKRKKFSEAVIHQWAVQSPHRSTPFCTHFEKCGGCKLQHITYPHQLIWKREKVVQAFRKIGIHDATIVQPVEPSPQSTYYKNKLDFAFSNKRWLDNDEIKQEKKVDRNGIGFHVGGKFDRIIDIQHCYLQPEYSNTIRNKIKEVALEQSLTFHNPYTHQGDLRSLIIRNSSRNNWLIAIVFGEIEEEKRTRFLQVISKKLSTINTIGYFINHKKNDDLFDVDFHLFSGEPFLEEKLQRADGSNVEFQINVKSFFQTNTPQTENIYNKIIESLKKHRSKNILDLFTGVGSIALFVAPFVDKVTGIEWTKSAVENAKTNAALNQIENVHFFCDDINKMSQENPIFNQYFDTIICDPPRAGLSRQTVQALLRLKPNLLIYLSCNPDTQTRDIESLLEHYEVDSCTPFDMFPQTMHVENLVILKKK